MELGLNHTSVSLQGNLALLSQVNVPAFVATWSFLLVLHMAFTSWGLVKTCTVNPVSNSSHPLISSVISFIWMFIPINPNGGLVTVFNDVVVGVGVGANVWLLLSVWIKDASVVFVNCPLTFSWSYLFQALRTAMPFLSAAVVGSFELNEVELCLHFFVIFIFSFSLSFSLSLMYFCFSFAIRGMLNQICDWKEYLRHGSLDILVFRANWLLMLEN